MLDSCGIFKTSEQVLEGAAREAVSFQADKTGTEHIPDCDDKAKTECVATRLLHTMGISIQKTVHGDIDRHGREPAQIKEEMANAKSSREGQAAVTPTLTSTAGI